MEYLKPVLTEVGVASAVVLGPPEEFSDNPGEQQLGVAGLVPGLDD